MELDSFLILHINRNFAVRFGVCMNNNSKLMLAFLALFMLGLGVPMAAAQGNAIQYQNAAGNVTLTTDDIDIRISGVSQTPHFHWWDPDSPDVDYHVMFVKLFEANDTDVDGVFTLNTDMMVGPAYALPTSEWEFEGFEFEMEGDNVTAVHFNLTSTESHDPRPEGLGMGNLPNMDPFDVMVQLRIHIDLENPGEMKFDVVIDGWEWTHDDSILVLQFTVSESNHGQSAGDRDPTGFSEDATKFSFGAGYMEYEETAMAAQNQIEVKASHGEGTGLEAGESVYLAFEYFGNETLEYDPILGVESETGNILTDNILLIAGVGVVIAVVAIVALKARK